MGSDTIDNCLYNIQKCLMDRYGATAAEQEMYPLRWYIYTGRASVPFLKSLFAQKPSVIANILHKKGSDEEVLHNINNKLR